MQRAAPGLSAKGLFYVLQETHVTHMIRPLILLFWLCLSPFAFAQEELPGPIKFGGSEFTFTRGEDDEVALSYNGIELYRNFYVGFHQAAKVDGIDVALFFGSNGGNACGPSQLIVTLPENAPDPKLEIIGEDCGAPDPAVSRDRIAFVPWFAAPGRPEPLMIWTPAGGLIHMGEIHFVPQEGTNWSNFDLAKIADAMALFDNKDVFDAAASLLGGKLGDVVHGLSVSSGPQVIDGKFVAVFGCQPHACGAANAFFGIDLEKRQVFAANRISDAAEEFWPAEFKSWPLPLQTVYEASKNQ